MVKEDTLGVDRKFSKTTINWVLFFKWFENLPLILLRKKTGNLKSALRIPNSMMLKIERRLKHSDLARWIVAMLEIFEKEKIMTWHSM